MKEVICLNCNKTFTIKVNEYNRRIKRGNKNFYCCRKCYDEYRKAEKISCVVCGKLHRIRHDTSSKYCSRECWKKDKEIKDKYRECPNCNHFFNARFSTSKFCCHKCYTDYREYPTQENHPRWNGGEFTSRGQEHEEWRKNIFTRDNYTCQCCGQIGGKLNAHHLKAYCLYEEFRYDLNNGLTLCEECHKKVHNYYGYKHEGEMIPIKKG